MINSYDSSAAALEKIRDALDKKSIYELRQIGRAVGVQRPSDMKKIPLVESILAIAKNEAAPVSPSLRGAPPKSDMYDRALVGEIERCRQMLAERTEEKLNVLQVNDGEAQGDEDGAVYSGVLEFAEKYWFLRTQNYQISSMQDVFVPQSYVNEYHLREGDYILCKAKRRKERECPGLTAVISVNGARPDKFAKRPRFESFQSYYADRRFTLDSGDGNLTDRVIDLFAPIGNGQRALLVSPPKAGKTTMLKNIACSLVKNYPAAKVMVLLIDERPEEVTDITAAVRGAEIVYSTFDKGELHHIHAANLAMERAKRLVEQGNDVVVLMDSITRLVRAYNAITSSGRTLSGGLDPLALTEPRKFFGSARNVGGGASLTIIATALVETGSRLDDVIYEELKAAGNSEIVLSRDMAERRVFPAVDIKSSGTRKEELLLSSEELETAYKLRSLIGRSANAENVLDMMKKTKSNSELCDKIDDWMRIYKNDR